MVRNFAFYIIAFIIISFANAGPSDSIKTREIKGHRSKINFRNRIFEDEDWKGVDFQNQDFSGNTFIEVNFTGAYLKGSKFENVLFKNVNFTKACLTSVKFINCQFKHVNFQHADLREGRFIDSLFYKSGFMYANVKNTVIYCSSSSTGELFEKPLLKMQGVLNKESLENYRLLLEKIIQERTKTLTIDFLQPYEILTQEDNCLHTLKMCFIISPLSYMMNEIQTSVARLRQLISPP